jgi:CubicO group peptidase (beta-lactamase class C family)
MNRRRLILLVLLAMLAPRAALAQAAGAAATSNAAKVDAIFAEREKPSSPGCALGIFRNGEIEYARGYGLANLEHNIPITTKTIFDLGSVSKQFTAASVILLAQQGTLTLDDDVRKWVPELPDYGRRITIRHLLNHTSGLRDYLTLFSLSGVDFDGVTNDDDALRVIVRQKELNFPPGSEYLYSNSGYFLLSVIVKRASGKSLREFAQAGIFEPLGMKHSHFHDNHTELVPLRATAYAPREKSGWRLDMSGFEQTGDGAVFTSIEDFLQWERNFESQKVGGPALLDELQARGKLTNGEMIDYAAGLVHSTYKGIKLVGHGGSWAGYRAAYLRVPEEKLAVVCLCNFANASPDQYARRALEVYLAVRISAAAAKTEEPPVMQVPESELMRWVGVYRSASSGTVRRIQFRDGKLRADTFGASSNELAPLGSARFRVLGPPVKVILSLSQPPGSAPARLTVEAEGSRPETLEGVAAFEPTAEQLADFAGEFASDELDAPWKLRVEEGKLTLRIGNSPARPLVPTFRDAFIGQGLQLIFARAADGKLGGFSIQAGRVRNIRFVRR